MAAVKVDRGVIVFRNWDTIRGLQETEMAFGSLEELFELCARTADPRIVDRIMLDGRLADGTERSVMLTFQSTSGQDS